MGTSCVIAVGGEAMWRSLLFFACALRSDGWFCANETSTPDKGPWREWLDSSSPTIARALETVEERAAQARDWGWRPQRGVGWMELRAHSRHHPRFLWMGHFWVRLGWCEEWVQGGFYNLGLCWLSAFSHTMPGRWLGRWCHW